MDALESPLEALAFNYLSYGFLMAVNNIWAWVAVITAAVSFWRIRSSQPTTPARIRSSSTAELGSVDVLSAAGVAESTSAEPARVSSSGNSEATSKASFRVLERQGSTKMKFSLYFEEGREFRENDGGGEAAAVVSEKWWCDDWERMMEMRMGDMGWYRWQDTTALDGGVVRLWEGRRRRGAAAW